MDRTITVRGQGHVRQAPDQVELTLTLSAEDRAYEAAMAAEAEQMAALEGALEAVGHQREALRTAGLDVSAQYDYQNDQRGNSVRLFRGYACTRRLCLTFPLDTALLGRTLSAIADCPADPELNIRFTVADPAAVGEALLQRAAADARGKAEVLCAASGVALGPLVEIRYNWADLEMFSPTALAAGNGLLRSKAMMDVRPEDIDLTDEATFVWEIR